jgi:alpha-tubulin suppressor-like RCC1 family protein
VPVQVTLPRSATQAIQGGNGPGDGQTLGMLSDGTVYAWGSNGAFQLCTGTQKKEASQAEPTAWPAAKRSFAHPGRAPG